jgi:hypothetical protein
MLRAAARPSVEAFQMFIDGILFLVRDETWDVDDGDNMSPVSGYASSLLRWMAARRQPMPARPK